jgi:hypothetical protein
MNAGLTFGVSRVAEVALLGRFRRRDEDLEAAFGEFDHYVGELPRNRKRGSVSGGFTTPDDPRDVIGYYTERLCSHGWRVEHGEDEAGLVGVTGRRGNLEYQVSVEEGDGIEWGTFAFVTAKRGTVDEREFADELG